MKVIFAPIQLNLRMPVPGRALPFKSVLVCYLVEVDKLLSIRHGDLDCGMRYAAFQCWNEASVSICQLPYFAIRQEKLHPECPMPSILGIECREVIASEPPQFFAGRNQTKSE